MQPVKVSFERKLLKSYLEFLKLAQTPKAVMPVLDYIKIGLHNGTLMAVSTCLDVTIKMALSWKIEGDNFAMLIDATNLVSILSKSDAENVTLSFEDKGVTLYEGLTGEYFFPQQGNPQEFPVFPKMKEGALKVMLDGGMLKKSVSQIIPFIGSNDTRPFLSGVCFSNQESGKEIIATDAHRIAIKTLGKAEEGFEKGIIWSKRFITLLNRVLIDAPIMMQIDSDSTMTAISNTTVVHTRHLVGNVPSYHNVIAKPESAAEKIIFNRLAMISLVDKMSVITDRIAMKLSSTVLTLAAENKELSSKATNKISVSRTLSNNDIFIGVNAELFLSVLNATNEENYEMEVFVVENEARTLIHRDENSIFLVMCLDLAK